MMRVRGWTLPCSIRTISLYERSPPVFRHSVIRSSRVQPFAFRRFTISAPISDISVPPGNRECYTADARHEGELNQADKPLFDHSVLPPIPEATDAAITGTLCEGLSGLPGMGGEVLTTRVVEAPVGVLSLS